MILALNSSPLDLVPEVCPSWWRSREGSDYPLVVHDVARQGLVNLQPRPRFRRPRWYFALELRRLRPGHPRCARRAVQLVQIATRACDRRGPSRRRCRRWRGREFVDVLHRQLEPLDWPWRRRLLHSGFRWGHRLIRHGCHARACARPRARSSLSQRLHLGFRLGLGLCLLGRAARSLGRVALDLAEAGAVTLNKCREGVGPGDEAFWGLVSRPGGLGPDVGLASAKEGESKEVAPDGQSYST